MAWFGVAGPSSFPLKLGWWLLVLEAIGGCSATGVKQVVPLPLLAGLGGEGRKSFGASSSTADVWRGSIAALFWSSSAEDKRRQRPSLKEPITNASREEIFVVEAPEQNSPSSPLPDDQFPNEQTQQVAE